MKKFLPVLCLLPLCFSAPAAAQELTLLPEGQTLISLSVTERLDVPQDTLSASLRIEAQDKSATEVQSKVNAAVSSALALSKKFSTVKTSTGYYSVYQSYSDPNNPRSVKTWHGSQSLDLEGKDAQSLLELTGKLQEQGFALNNLSYSLSIAKSDEVRESLLEQALQRAKAKAERAAKGLGKSSVELVQVDVDNSEESAMPVRMRSMAVASAKAESFDAPVASAGESTVTLTVRVRAIAK